MRFISTLALVASLASLGAAAGESLFVVCLFVCLFVLRDELEGRKTLRGTNGQDFLVVSLSLLTRFPSLSLASNPLYFRSETPHSSGYAGHERCVRK